MVAVSIFSFNNNVVIRKPLITKKNCTPNKPICVIKFLVALPNLKDSHTCAINTKLIHIARMPSKEG